ncbi:MAG: hypothetical protein HKN09_12830 [Saprospiraceae bacterium]|nr:hypothetical protein [Saprospiraceae bacterium]
MKNYNEEYLFDETLGRHAYSFSLGVKEVLFLSMILFFGFSGFSLCVEKIYASKTDKSIDNITIHQLEVEGQNSISYVDMAECLDQK